MRTQTLIGLFVAATVGVVVLVFVSTSGGGGSKSAISLGTPTAAAACDKASQDCMPQVQFVDVDGKTYSASSLTGKVVIVNFWATWCGPCQKEIPSFSRIYDKYKSKGVLFLGVMTDNPDAQTFLNFASDYNITYPIVRDNQDINNAFGFPSALPTTYIFDRGGKQLTRHVGPLSDDALEQILGPLIAST
jgi:thiol-disulfide isomerase/thioredoxin